MSDLMKPFLGYNTLWGYAGGSGGSSGNGGLVCMVGVVGILRFVSLVGFWGPSVIFGPLWVFVALMRFVCPVGTMWAPWAQ